MAKEKKIIQSESMILPFNGNHIFYSSLDGLSDDSMLVKEKFLDDLQVIKKPSSPTLIAIHLYGTDVKRDVAEFIITQLIHSGAFVKKIAFVGVKRLASNKIKSNIKKYSPNLVYSFFIDYEKAKLWLVS